MLRLGIDNSDAASSVGILLTLILIYYPQNVEQQLPPILGRSRMYDNQGEVYTRLLPEPNL